MKWTNPVFVWCWLNLCPEKSTFVPYLVKIVQIFARTEARQAPYSMTWVYCSAVMQIQCSPVDVPPRALVVFGEKQLSGSTWKLVCRQRTIWQTTLGLFMSFRLKTAELYFSIDEQSSRLAAFPVELCYCAEGSTVGWCTWCRACKAEIVLKVGKSSLFWCRRNFCPGKIYIRSIFGPNPGIICQEQRHAVLPLAWHGFIVLVWCRLNKAQSTSHLLQTWFAKRKQHSRYL